LQWEGRRWPDIQDWQNDINLKHSISRYSNKSGWNPPAQAYTLGYHYTGPYGFFGVRGIRVQFKEFLLAYYRNKK